MSKEKKQYTITHLWRMTPGRKPFYDTPEKLVEKIGEYLEWEEACSKGKFTVSGCALYLGFSCKEALYRYKERNEGYKYVIDRFYLFMEHFHSQKLQWAGSYQGSAFWLKNFAGWKDEVVQNQNITNVKADFGTAVQPARESAEDSSGDT